jgi:transposase
MTSIADDSLKGIIGGTARRAMARGRSMPTKASRKTPHDFDRHVYKARHLIENFFAELKQYRAIAVRYDKTSRNFLAAIHLVAAVVWLN